MMRAFLSILVLTTFGILPLQSFASTDQIPVGSNMDRVYLVAEPPQILRRSPSRSLIAPGNRESLSDAPYPLRRFPSQSLIAPGNRHDLSRPPHTLRRFPQRSLIAPGNR